MEGFEEDKSYKEENPAFAFTVVEGRDEEVCKVLTTSEPTMKLSINGIVKALIDSGSMSNLMGEEDFQKLKSAGFKGNTEHCPEKLFAYGGKQIDVIGQFGAEMSVRNAKVTTKFILVKHGHCILGNVQLL